MDSQDLLWLGYSEEEILAMEKEWEDAFYTKTKKN